MGRGYEFDSLPLGVALADFFSAASLLAAALALCLASLAMGAASLTTFAALGGIWLYSLCVSVRVEVEIINTKLISVSNTANSHSINQSITH